MMRSLYLVGCRNIAPKRSNGAPLREVGSCGTVDVDFCEIIEVDFFKIIDADSCGIIEV